MKQKIIRRKEFSKDRIWIETHSTEKTLTLSNYGKWYNCIYMYLIKEDHSEIKFPPLVDCNWSHKNGKRFDYYDSDFSKLDWHGGVTFYEEKKDLETGRTIVKVGADYQHYMDGDYMQEDCGELILKCEAEKLHSQLMQIKINSANNSSRTTSEGL